MTTITLNDEQRQYLIETLAAQEKRCRTRAERVDSQRAQRANNWEAAICDAIISQAQDAAEGK